MTSQHHTVTTDGQVNRDIDIIKIKGKEKLEHTHLVCCMYVCLYNLAGFYSLVPDSSSLEIFVIIFKLSSVCVGQINYLRNCYERLGRPGQTDLDVIIFNSDQKHPGNQLEDKPQ